MACVVYSHETDIVEAARMTMTPWWDAYRILLLRTTPNYSQELFNLPVACASPRRSRFLFRPPFALPPNSSGRPIGLVLLSATNKTTVESVAKLQTSWVQDANVPARDVLTDPKTLRHYVVLTDGECGNHCE